MIDAHCHLDLYPKPTDVAERAARANVVTIMVTNLPSAFEKAYPHVQAFDKIRPALGLHPLLAPQHQLEYPRFAELIDKTSYIGEVGLDFSRDGYNTRDLQIDSFRFVLKTIGERRKFISIHSRRAETAVLDLLGEASFSSPVVFHWYTGPLNVLERAVRDGHFFSINPAMINSPSGKKIIGRIPPAQALTETDGPFVKIDSRAAEPHDVDRVERYLSTEWSVSRTDVRRSIKDNLLRILRPIKISKAMKPIKVP